MNRNWHKYNMADNVKHNITETNLKIQQGRKEFCTSYKYSAGG